MSIETKVPLAHARAVLTRLENLLAITTTCARWQVCGSIRRHREMVGDVDIVAISNVVHIPVAGLFVGEDARGPALWLRVDELLSLGTITKAVKDTKAGPRTKWGDGARSFLFEGICFEVQLADEDNWALWVAVRTGPAELSKLFVTAIPKHGYRIADGFHIYNRNDPAGGQFWLRNLTEEQIFAKAGLAYRPPELR